MNAIIKQAWINKDKKIISFETTSGGWLYTAEESSFWKTVVILCDQGYRIQ